MARRKNQKRRKEILSNTFSLIRANGLDKVSLQKIAESSNISKSLLQSYYSHKSVLINELVDTMFSALGDCIEEVAQDENQFAKTETFIYLILTLGTIDPGIDQLIREAFRESKALNSWSNMLFNWLHEQNLFEKQKYSIEIRGGVPFVASGAARLYAEKEKLQLNPLDISEYAIKTLMFSFFNEKKKVVNATIEEARTLIEKLDAERVLEYLEQTFYCEPIDD
ncbi:MAG: TetR/AcrR family transcriptional regulator [Lactobacillus sp.]|nr:TetR/AcrR family transcriptional regulator [Lactobacillus sp.]